MKHKIQRTQQAPRGIEYVAKYMPDKERMLKALRIILESLPPDKGEELQAAPRKTT